MVKLIDTLINLWNKYTHNEKDVKQLTYDKEFEDIEKDIQNKEVKKLDYDNSKKNILIMDDDVMSISFIEDDIKIFKIISKRLKQNAFDTLPIKYQEFYNMLNKSDQDFLKYFNIEDYKIVEANTDMACYSVENAIENGMRVDSAILDIILGGYTIVRDKFTVLNGIDVASYIWESNPKANIKFYTGCTLSHYSNELVEFKEKNPTRGDLEDYVIIKDNDLIKRRILLLRLLKNA